MYLIHHACRLSRTLSSSSFVGCLSCLVNCPLCHHCCLQVICPAEASSSVPHVVVVVVIHGTFVLWRPCPCRYLVGLVVCRLFVLPRRPSLATVVVIIWWGPCHPFPMSSSSVVPHIVVVVVVVCGPFVLQRPHPHCHLVGALLLLGNIVCPPHCCHHCHCPWGICPVETLSSSLSGGGLVVPSSTLLSLLSMGHLSCKGLVAVVVR